MVPTSGKESIVPAPGHSHFTTFTIIHIGSVFHLALILSSVSAAAMASRRLAQLVSLVVSSIESTLENSATRRSHGMGMPDLLCKTNQLGDYILVALSDVE